MTSEAPFTASAVGRPLDRIDGPAKVTGTATYASEWLVENPVYVYPLQAPIAAGRITAVDCSRASSEPGVVAVLTHQNAPRVASEQDRELAILQSGEVSYRGQIVGAVIAETSEAARSAAGLVRLEYEQRAHDVGLRSDHEDLHEPTLIDDYSPFGISVTGTPVPSVKRAEIDAALASSAVRLDATYTTPAFHHNPMEPHANIAIWTPEGLTVYCGSQGVHAVKHGLTALFGLDPGSVRVISPHVGGAFGCKAAPHPDVVLAVMAARLVSPRPAKLVLTRRQMFSQVGYRSPTIQRIEIGAAADGRLLAIAHDSIEQTARIKEFAEHATRSTRAMYAAPVQRTTQRIAALDVPVPAILRAPGEGSGMFALESAIDEIAIACRIDPIELRIRNEPVIDPASGLPFSSRNLVACLQQGAHRFGWQPRDPTPRARRENGWLLGTGVAATCYPMFRLPGSAAIRALPSGGYTVSLGAADIGTGAWTALTQIAADALGVPIGDVELQIGDSDLPFTSGAGGSSGIISWGTWIVEAAGQFKARLQSEHNGVVPPEGLEVAVQGSMNPDLKKVSMYTFGAHFAEARVREDTGEVRVPRLLGMYDAGRIINPKTARSQLLGGLTWGLSMALHEHSVIDPRFGHVINQDLATYHVAANADVDSVEVYWLDEPDTHFGPTGAKGIGEIGIVSTAAAIANAVFHATGRRIRSLPITIDQLM
ncbi:MAG TPA: xanthine dehydrogenase family protein molybdopterin-binding subunit [Trebonia sp.]